MFSVCGSLGIHGECVHGGVHYESFFESIMSNSGWVFGGYEMCIIVISHEMVRLNDRDRAIALCQLQAGRSQRQVARSFGINQSTGRKVSSNRTR